MRIFILLFLLVGSFSSAATKSADGGSVGNGGDPIGLDFLQNANKVIEDVLAEIHLYPEIKNIDLRATIKEIKVIVTDETIWVTINGQKQISTAVNYSDTKTVLINRTLWNKIPTREQKLSLVFHEVLGLVRIESSGDYSVSKRYLSSNFENSELIITRMPFPIIPASNISCQKVKSTPPGKLPEPDVSAGYFRIPTLRIFRSYSAKDLVITAIRITYVLPSEGNQPPEISQCFLSGDSLLALSDKWWNRGSEAIIPAKSGTIEDMFSTDCPIICGGIRTREKNFITTADVDVFGLERDPQTLDETPVKMNRTIKIRGF
ncbi:MAG: hypothetical protein ACXVB1_07690 [Pseudobdellovibrionaceae bacterium]